MIDEELYGMARRKSSLIKSKKKNFLAGRDTLADEPAAYATDNADLGKFVRGQAIMAGDDDRVAADPTHEGRAAVADPAAQVPQRRRINT